MATRSEAGGNLPPGVGIITESVVKSRPDLVDMVGFTVRVPRSLDIEANDGPQRVWVQGPSDGVEGGKSVAFPTIVLSAEELRTVYRGDGGASGSAGKTRGGISGLVEASSSLEPSRAEDKNFEKSSSLAKKGVAKGRVN
jgi:hypothetical protein